MAAFAREEEKRVGKCSPPIALPTLSPGWAPAWATES